MPTNRPPGMATGPALMQKLLEIEQKVDDLANDAHIQWGKEEQRMRLVDQFIDPQLDLSAFLKQLFGILQHNHTSVQELEREMRRLTSAVELLLSDSHDQVDYDQAHEV